MSAGFPRLTAPSGGASNAAVTPMSEAQWGFFLTVAGRVVPAVAQLEKAGQAGFREIVLKALSDRPRSVQRQFALFLGVIRWALDRIAYALGVILFTAAVVSGVFASAGLVATVVIWTMSNINVASR